MAKRRPGKPKPLTYELIERESEIGRGLYDVLDGLVEQHHEDLRDARIALAWCTSWKPDVDGRVTLGKCKRASDLDRELTPYDFVILLSRPFFEDPLVTPLQRRARIDHELCHAALKYDSRGEPVEDGRGRKVYRIRKHDLEEFSAIASRYGCWKRDLEHFAAAIDRARHQSPDYWIGTERLRQQLIAAGLTVPLDTIASWTQAERREAEEWALLRQELDRLERPSLLDTSLDPPPHLVVLTAARQETPQ
jgi:hypothetical protein